MAELKVGFQAVFYKGEEVRATSSVKESYEESVKDIENENKMINTHDIAPFTHAKVEKIYYRH